MNSLNPFGILYFTAFLNDVSTSGSAFTKFFISKIDFLLKISEAIPTSVEIKGVLVIAHSTIA